MSFHRVAISLYLFFLAYKRRVNSYGINFSLKGVHLRCRLSQQRKVFVLLRHSLAVPQLRHLLVVLPDLFLQLLHDGVRRYVAEDAGRRQLLRVVDGLTLVVLFILSRVGAPGRDSSVPPRSRRGPFLSCFRRKVKVS